MSVPAVSVVLPVYNAARYLPQAIDSILKQSFTKFELIAVDDGSTDDSPRILRGFAERDPRVRVISRANTGIVGALNDGIGASHAELIARMDSDDISLPERLEKQVSYMNEHRDCVLLGAQVQVIDPHGMPLFRSANPLDHESIDAALMLGKGGVLRHPSAIIRRDAFTRVGGYRPQYQWAEDVDLFLRLAEVGRIANLPDILLHYRQHCGSVNRTRYQQQARRITQVVREAAQRRGLSLAENWQYDMKIPPDAGEQLREWGWRALKERRLSVARKHALSAVQKQPLSIASWRLMYCAIRGW